MICSVNESSPQSNNSNKEFLVCAVHKVLQMAKYSVWIDNSLSMKAIFKLEERTSLSCCIIYYYRVQIIKKEKFL